MSIKCNTKSSDVFLNPLKIQQKEWNVDEVLEGFKEAICCIDYLKTTMGFR